MKRKYTDQQLIEAVAKCCCITQVARKIGLVPGGAARVSVAKHIRRLALDTSHWKYADAFRPPLSEYMVVNSTLLNRKYLKDRILEEGLLENKCAICGLEPWWNNRPLVLQLDHVNGNRKDHRLENLRFLCPNCHTQTPTFGGRDRSLASATLQDRPQ